MVLGVDLRRGGKLVCNLGCGCASVFWMVCFFILAGLFLSISCGFLFVGGFAGGSVFVRWRSGLYYLVDGRS